MDREHYPALYLGADSASNNAQKEYLNLLRAEYFLLVCAAAFSMSWATEKYFLIAYALVFVAAAAILLFRSFRKPEQDWYRCRALAESIKTSTWRYMMRAEPFNDAESIRIPRAEFRNHLREILRYNKQVGENIAGYSSDEEQITGEMERVRLLSLEQRKDLYKSLRIADQRKWYTKKAGANKSAFRFWVSIMVLVYLLATLSVLLRISFPEIKLWPTEPLTVLAASIVGWIQIKKFNELSSSYTLTAHEIGIIQGRIDEIEEEGEFSDFVNEAELAFSREHTQWVARQHE